MVTALLAKHVLAEMVLHSLCRTLIKCRIGQIQYSYLFIFSSCGVPFIYIYFGKFQYGREQIDTVGSRWLEQCGRCSLTY